MGIFDFFKKNKNSAPIEVEKETYTDEHGLCVCYPTEYVGTAEEEKLKRLLDEIAKSFKLI